jgi:hypothetical protein
LEKTGYTLKLMMNPAKFRYKWDGEAVELIDNIMKNKNQADVDELVKLMQSWLALEWYGMMKEAKNGILSDKEKNRLRNEHYTQYKKYR